MIGYDWLSSAVIGSFDPTSCVCVLSRISLNEQYNGVNGKTNIKKFMSCNLDIIHFVT